MSLQILEKFLPQQSLSFLQKWFAEYNIHIKITRNRQSKLGDYRKLPSGGHQITINGTLQSDLFFFVLTHELAHLIAFETFGKKILPHGQEWKHTFRNMLFESISIYTEDLQPIIIHFSKSPKANFMASPELVRYFGVDALLDTELYIEDLQNGEKFMYRNMHFEMIEKKKKNYLCLQSKTGKLYLFKPLAKVEKTPT